MRWRHDHDLVRQQIIETVEKIQQPIAQDFHLAPATRALVQLHGRHALDRGRRRVARIEQEDAGLQPAKQAARSGRGKRIVIVHDQVRCVDRLEELATESAPRSQQRVAGFRMRILFATTLRGPQLVTTHAFAIGNDVTPIVEAGVGLIEAQRHAPGQGKEEFQQQRRQMGGAEDREARFESMRHLRRALDVAKHLSHQAGPVQLVGRSGQVAHEFGLPACVDVVQARAALDPVTDPLRSRHRVFIEQAGNVYGQVVALALIGRVAEIIAHAREIPATEHAWQGRMNAPGQRLARERGIARQRAGQTAQHLPDEARRQRKLDIDRDPAAARDALLQPAPEGRMGDNHDVRPQRIAAATRLQIVDQPIGKDLQPVSVNELCCQHHLPFRRPLRIIHEYAR